MNRLFLISIILLSFSLNIYGLKWGLPSKEQARLYFTNEAEIARVTEDIKQYMEQGTWQTSHYGPERDRLADLHRSQFNLIRTYHPDESQYVKPLSHMRPSKLDFNPHYFTTAAFFTYLVGAFSKAASLFGFLTVTPDISYYYLHPDEFGKIYLIGRLLAAIMGVLTVYLTYLIGKRLFSEKIGLVSALFLSVTPVLVIHSHYLKMDVPMTFWLTLTFLLITHILVSDKMKWYIWAGIGAGLTAGTKYHGGLLIWLIIPVAHLLREGINKKSLLSLFGRKLFLSGIASLVAFLLVNPYIVLAFDEFRRDFFGLGAKVAFSQAASTEDSSYLGLYYFRYVFACVMGLPFYILTMAGVIFALIKRNKADLLIFAFLILSFSFLNLSRYKMANYTIPLMPFLALWASRLVLSITSPRVVWNYSRIAVIAAIFVYTLLYSLAFDNLFARKNVRIVAGEWITSNIEPGARIGLTDGQLPYLGPPINELKYRVVMAGNSEQLNTVKPDYFVISDYRFRPYLGEASAEDNLRFLKESGYAQIQKFELLPTILGITFKKKDRLVLDWLHPYPTILVFKRESLG